MKLEIEGRRRDLPGRSSADRREYLAPDYYSMEDLEACIPGAGNLFYVVTDADRGGAVVSYLLCLPLPLDEALAMLQVSEKAGGAAEIRRGHAGGRLQDGQHGKGLPALRYLLFLRPQPGACPAGARREADPGSGHALSGRRGSHGRILQDKRAFPPSRRSSGPGRDMDIYCPYCGQYHCICDAVFLHQETGQNGGGRG